ncbi:MAG: hypothetical protein ACR2NU_02265 [Aeoliella sp.]
MQYSPDGSIIAVGTDEQFVRLYEARTGKLIDSFTGHDDEIRDVAFHPNGTMMASCDKAGVIRTWQLGELTETSESSELENWPASFHGHAKGIWSLDFSPDGKRLVSVGKDGNVRSWGGRSHLLQELDVTESVASDYSRSGNELFVARRHAIARWDQRTNVVHPFGKSFQEQAKSLAVSPDGEIIATGHNDGIIRLWHRKTEQIVQVLHGHKDEVHQIAFSSDGILMVTASWDGTGILWDVAAGQQRHVVDLPPHCVSAAFCKDGRTFAISQEDNFMIYDAGSGERLHLLQGHTNSANCVAFSPDGRWLATGSDDRTIRIWDVLTGQTRHVIAAHREKIISIAFSPDSRTIATGDDRGNVAFSHVKTGRFLFRTSVASGKIGTVRFSPDGKTLAATRYGKHVVLLYAPDLPTFDEEFHDHVLIVDAESNSIGNGMIPRVEFAWVGLNQHQQLAVTDDNFGCSVSVSGSTAIVGASHFGNTGGKVAGAAHVFVQRDGNWIAQQELIASDAAADGRFGVSVAVDGDSAIIGAYNDSFGGGRSIGSAYIFTRTDGVWTEQQKLTASNSAGYDRFGLSVSLSGNTALIGSHADDDRGRNSGSAYIFTRVNGVWTEQKKLTASDGAKGDQFGHSVSISGNTAVVGAMLNDDKIGRGIDCGSVYVFTRSGNIWSEQKKLTASDGAAYDKFGRSVSVSGDTLIVGAAGHDAAGTDSGKAYLFMRSDGAWKELQLTPSNAAAGNRFGHSVSVSGKTAVVGAWSDNSDANSGSAHVFSRRGERWIEQPKLTAFGITEGDFGFSVSLDGRTAIVGSHSIDADRSGAAHVFQ